MKKYLSKIFKHQTSSEYEYLIDSGVSDWERAISKGINWMSVIIFIINIVCVPFFTILLHDSRIVWGSLVEVLGLGVVVLLNYRGKYTYANLGFILILNLACLYFGLILGKSGSIILMSIFLTGASMFIFNSLRDKAISISITVLVLLALMAAYQNNLDNPKSIGIAQQIWLEWTAIFVVLALVIVVFILFANFKDAVIKKQTEIITNEKQFNDTQNIHLHCVAHSNKNFLGVIAGAIELCSMDMGEEVTKESFKLIDESIIHLKQLTENLLYVTRIETTTFSPSWDLLELGAVVAHVINENKTRAIMKNITVEYDEFGRLGSKVIGADETLLNMCLNNLLVNAIKYSNANTVVRVLLEENPEDEMVNIIVVNNALPIPSELKANIFKKHYKFQTAKDFSQSSSGIGLFVTAEALKRMNCSISVFSTEEKTEFTISIPYKNKVTATLYKNLSNVVNN